MILLDSIDIPKVSYVIPVRDESESLEITLRNLNIISSRYSFEIIIVDDHSTEPITELIDDELLAKCIILRNERRLGVAKSRAKGAEKACGDFLIFLDAHICFRKDMLDQFFLISKYYPTSLFGIPIFNELNLDKFRSYVDGNMRRCSQEVYAGWRVELREKPDVAPIPLKKEYSFPYRVPIVGAASMIVSRELYFRLGGFDQDLIGYGNAEDAEFCLRAWAFGCEVRVMPKSMVAHYVSPEKFQLKEVSRTSATHAQYDLSEENATRVICLHLPKKQIEKYVLKDRCDDKNYLEPIEDRISFIEINRVWSKEQVLRLATESIFIDNLSPLGINLKSDIFIISDSEEACSNLLMTLPEAMWATVLCGTLQLKLILRERFPQISCLYLFEDSKLDSLDELFHFYRGEVWGRGFKGKDQILSNNPYIINTKCEDAVLQYAAPIWMVEDSILHHAGSGGATLYLALKNSLLEKALQTSVLLSKSRIKVK